MVEPMMKCQKLNYNVVSKNEKSGINTVEIAGKYLIH